MTLMDEKRNIIQKYSNLFMWRIGRIADSCCLRKECISMNHEQESWQRMAEELQAQPTEEKLWETVIACQGVVFQTYSGLPFTYRLRTGKNGEYTKELWIDRRENSKSLVWSSVLLAFQKVKHGKIVVKRPKELGDIRGISYIYALFLKFGLIEPYQNILEEQAGRDLKA